MTEDDVKRELESIRKSSAMISSKIQVLNDLKERIRLTDYSGIRVTSSHKSDLSDVVVKIEQMEAEILKDIERNYAERIKWNDLMRKHLSIKQFTVFLFRYLSGDSLSIEEIADKLECSYQNVQNILRRGFKQIAENMQ